MQNFNKSIVAMCFHYFASALALLCLIAQVTVDAREQVEARVASEGQRNESHDRKL